MFYHSFYLQADNTYADFSFFPTGSIKCNDLNDFYLDELLNNPIFLLHFSAKDDIDIDALAAEIEGAGAAKEQEPQKSKGKKKKEKKKQDFE